MTFYRTDVSNLGSIRSQPPITAPQNKADYGSCRYPAAQSHETSLAGLRLCINRGLNVTP